MSNININPFSNDQYNTKNNSNSSFHQTSNANFKDLQNKANKIKEEIDENNRNRSDTSVFTLKIPKEENHNILNLKDIDNNNQSINPHHNQNQKINPTKNNEFNSANNINGFGLNLMDSTVTSKKQSNKNIKNKDKISENEN